jgi:hypothetical protein
MMLFADKVGGWGWANADASKNKKKKSKEKTFLCVHRKKSVTFFNKKKPRLILALFLEEKYLYLCHI